MLQINKQNPELGVVCLSQPVAADLEPFRDLLPKLPWDKTFRLTEKSTVAVGRDGDQFAFYCRRIGNQYLRHAHEI
jgi:hypothetical protein